MNVDEADVEQRYRARFPRLFDHWDAYGSTDRATFLSGLPAIRTDLEESRRTNYKRLRRLLSRATSLDLVTRACLTYLYVDSPVETRDDDILAYPEYLISQALTSIPELFQVRVVESGAASKSTCMSLYLTKRIFEDSRMILTLESISKSESAAITPTEKHQYQTRLSALLGRRPPHHSHVVRVLRGCFDPIADALANSFGYTVTDALAILELVERSLLERVAPDFEQVPRLRNEVGQTWSEHGADTVNTESLAWLTNLPTNEIPIQLERLAIAKSLARPRDISTFSPYQIAEALGISENTVRHFFDDFSRSRATADITRYRFPYGPNPIWTTPILKVRNEYIFPLPHQAVVAIRPRLEHLIKARTRTTSDAINWEEYIQNRSKFLEDESSRILAESLPGSTRWVRVPWRSHSDPSGSAGELDGLVAQDDLCLRIECKAGDIRPAARGGRQAAMNTAWSSLIDSAISQHNRLDAHLDQFGSANPDMSPSVLSGLRGPLTIRLIVSLEDLTVWAPRVPELQGTGLLEESTGPVWVLSIMDLMAITDLLRGIDLIAYVVWRQQHIGKNGVDGHEELRWLNYFLHHGYCIETRDDLQRSLAWDTGDAISHHQSSMSENPTCSTPAILPCPSPIEELMHRLQNEHPDHWVLAAVTLVSSQFSRPVHESGDTDLDFASGLAIAMDSTLPESRHLVCILENEAKLGLVVYTDHVTASQQVRANAASLLQDLITERGVDNWILIGEGADRKLFVQLRHRQGIAVLARILTR